MSLSKQDQSDAYTFLNDKTKNWITKEHKLYIFKNQINLDKNMEDLPVMYQFPKMHENPVSFHFIIASPVCTVKPLWNELT